MTDQELSELIRVYHQYDMDFVEFIEFAAASCKGACENEYKLLEGVKFLDMLSHVVSGVIYRDLQGDSR